MKEVKDFFPDYHDGEFLAPKSGAKLASLFDLDQAESQGNESFQFTAPKQPKKNSTATVGGPPSQKPAPPPTAPAVLFATGVHAFRFVNGQYVTQGKLGAAILGNHVTKEYTLLLYGSQQKHIATARIYPGFVLTVQPGNYTTFYDDQRQNWSLKFDTEKAGLDFCKEVCLAKWNSQSGVDTVLIQDLLHGEGRPVDMGDTVEVLFSGWLFQNHTMGQMFDSNMGKNKLHQVRLGSGKAQKGWEEGMVGMQKGGRRLLIVPPNISGSKGIPSCVPFTSTLIFDVEIHQVNFSEDGDCLSNESSDSMSSSSILALDNSNTDQSAICVSPDQGEQAPQEGLQNELQKPSDAAKAKLISRMAKMGQPMLPFLAGAIPAQSDPSDSETENISESGTSNDPCLPVINTKSFPQPVQMASKPPSCAGPDLSSFLITESRQQNTEIRLAVERVADRVDQLASKENATLKKEVLEKGSKVEEQSRKIGELIEERQRHVFQNSSPHLQYTEQSSLLKEQKNDVLQNSSQHNHARLLQAEREKVHLAEELSSSSSRICELQDEAMHHQQRAAELQTKLSAALEEGRSHSALISSLQAQVEELRNAGGQSQQQWRTEKQKCRKMEMTVKIMEEEIHDLRAEKEALDQMLSDRKKKWQLERQRLLKEQEEQSRSSEEEIQQLRRQLRRATNNTGQQAVLELEWQERCDAAVQEQRIKLEEVITHLQEQVKRVMNGLFHSLRAQFEMQEFYTGDSVLKVLLKTIKRVTMRLLEEHREVLSEAGDEEEEYLSTEEAVKEENMKEGEIRHENKDHFQVSLDQTYMTAYETAHLESSELTSDSSIASTLDGQPVGTRGEGHEKENDSGCDQSELITPPYTHTKIVAPVMQTEKE
ncbi:hypothetical protein NFI96_005573 [Prochilodus magdalenae]|nr:hypothetical protein NFI96_005573 [Prochilodus magdalenae]